ncbi:MAG: hypothetical protein KIT17_05640 [Rubrivivax sp.]|nr:hypothetical protein [Rubrivivax sp.]
MLIVALAWIYVVGMAAIAEALSPQGSVLGALATFVFYGVLPLAIVLYLLATPARKRALRRAEQRAATAAPTPPEAVAPGGAEPATPSAPLDPDGGRHAPAGAAGVARAVAPEREEP